MAQAPPKAGAKELLYSLQLYSLHPCFHEGDSSRFAKESLPTEIGKGRHWTSVFVCGRASNAARFAQGQPNGYFQMKELDGTIGPSVLSSTCQHVATLQFVSRAETDKFEAFSGLHPCFRRRLLFAAL